MRLVDNRGVTDARVNLALEEHVFRHHPVDDDVLLFYVNAPAIIDAVTAALRPRPGKVESKGVKSIRSRVANIREFVDAPLTVDALRAAILAGIFGTADPARIPTLPLDDADWAAVAALVERRYGAWRWNYGEDPPCNVQRARRFATGEVDVRLHVEGGRITAARLFGDYMGERDVGALEALLVGVPYERHALARALAGVEVGTFVGAAVGADDLVALLAP